MLTKIFIVVILTIALAHGQPRKNFKECIMSRAKRAVAGCKGDTCFRSIHGVILRKGQSLVSRNSRYKLSMQHDGNLVISIVLVTVSFGSPKPMVLQSKMDSMFKVMEILFCTNTTTKSYGIQEHTVPKSKDLSCKMTETLSLTENMVHHTGRQVLTEDVKWIA
eukprot:TCONS_00016838-protein